MTLTTYGELCTEVCELTKSVCGEYLVVPIASGIFPKSGNPLAFFHCYEQQCDRTL